MASMAATGCRPSRSPTPRPTSTSSPPPFPTDSIIIRTAARTTRRTASRGTGTACHCSGPTRSPTIPPRASSPGGSMAAPRCRRPPTEGGIPMPSDRSIAARSTPRACGKAISTTSTGMGTTSSRRASPSSTGSSSTPGRASRRARWPRSSRRSPPSRSSWPRPARTSTARSRTSRRRRTTPRSPSRSRCTAARRACSRRGPRAPS
mmetsp:Transcript_42447/g.104027  ORF Transcript_42447/g.104027 Transcript_42447/m.104027 type:complete len:206 (+) Transcript_42447:79-696(+)